MGRRWSVEEWPQVWVRVVVALSCMHATLFPKSSQAQRTAYQTHQNDVAPEAQICSHGPTEPGSLPDTEKSVRQSWLSTELSCWQALENIHSSMQLERRACCMRTWALFSFFLCWELTTPFMDACISYFHHASLRYAEKNTKEFEEFCLLVTIPPPPMACSYKPLSNSLLARMHFGWFWGSRSPVRHSEEAWKLVPSIFISGLEANCVTWYVYILWLSNNKSLCAQHCAASYLH